VEAAVDVGDQAGPAGEQEQGADAAGGEAADSIGQLVVDGVGVEHGALSLRPVAIGESAGDPALASSQLVHHLGIHSKAPVAWNGEDV
jgi:hypothetical protein